MTHTKYMETRELRAKLSKAILVLLDVRETGGAKHPSFLSCGGRASVGTELEADNTPGSPVGYRPIQAVLGSAAGPSGGMLRGLREQMGLTSSRPPGRDNETSCVPSQAVQQEVSCPSPWGLVRTMGQRTAQEGQGIEGHEMQTAASGRQGTPEDE